MATIVLKAGNPVDGNGGPVVGPAPQWGDDSDATYATAQYVGGAAVGSPRTDMPAVPLDVVNSVSLRVRARINPAANGGGHLSVGIASPNHILVAVVNLAGQFGTDIATVTVPVSASTTYGDLVAALTAGAQVETEATHAPGETITDTWIDVYEVAFLIDVPGGYTPPLTVFPRDDYAEVYPPPTSYQASGDVFGGYW